MAEPEVPTDEYDRQHGVPEKGRDFTPPPAGQEWTVESGNPVRDDPTPFKNLKGGGASAK